MNRDAETYALTLIESGALMKNENLLEYLGKYALADAIRDSVDGIKVYYWDETPERKELSSWVLCPTHEIEHGYRYAKRVEVKEKTVECWAAIDLRNMNFINWYADEPSGVLVKLTGTIKD